MKFECSFEDQGVHPTIVETLTASDWDEAAARAEVRLTKIVGQGRLNGDLAYVGSIKT